MKTRSIKRIKKLKAGGIVADNELHILELTAEHMSERAFSAFATFLEKKKIEAEDSKLFFSSVINKTFRK